MRAEMLIELAGEYQPVTEAIAKRPYDVSHRVPGCESQVYIWSKKNSAGRPEFFYAVENPQGISAKAIAAILKQTLSGAEPAEIKNVSPEIIHDLFGQALTMGRELGLKNMVAMTVALA